MSEAQYNALSVRLELQADCFAGVWAHHAQNRKLLEAGDVEEAMRAASAIGDDTIQRRTQGRIVPDSFTHGTSEQRMRWFMTGMKSGQISACNTFEGNQIVATRGVDPCAGVRSGARGRSRSRPT